MISRDANEAFLTGEFETDVTELVGLAGVGEFSPHGCISRISSAQFMADLMRQIEQQFGDCRPPRFGHRAGKCLQPFVRILAQPMPGRHEGEPLEPVSYSTCPRLRLVQRPICRVRGFRDDQPEGHANVASTTDRNRSQGPDQSGRQPSAWLSDQIAFKGNCSPSGGYVERTRGAPARVRRIASRAPMERRRAVSMTERMSA